MSVTVLGAVALVVAFMCFLLKIAPKVQAILAFIGTCIIAGGLFGSILHRGAVALSHVTDSLVGRAFGVAVPGILVIILLILFVHDLHPRKGASRRTFFVSMALAACLVAGLSSFGPLNNVPSDVRSGAANVSTIGG